MPPAPRPAPAWGVREYNYATKEVTAEFGYLTPAHMEHGFRALCAEHKLTPEQTDQRVADAMRWFAAHPGQPYEFTVGLYALSIHHLSTGRQSPGRNPQ